MTMEKFEDPGTEVWVCPSCCAPRSESGLCLTCEMERVRPVEFPVPMIAFLALAVFVILLAAVLLMLDAAWLAHLTFEGVKQ